MTQILYDALRAEFINLESDGQENGLPLVWQCPRKATRVIAP